MRATRFWVAAHCALLLASSSFLCCGKDEGIGAISSAGGASGDAAEPSAGVSSSTPTAGTEAGGGGVNNGGTQSGGSAVNGGTQTGGSAVNGGTQTGGGNGGTSSAAAGTSGAPDAPGGAADAGAAPIGGASGVDPLPGEQLTVCDRITQRSTHAFDIARGYDHAVYDDCRTRWVTNLYLVDKARDDFLNALQAWNLAFWGCGKDPVQDFALVYGTPALSAGDAAALIDKYMTIATTNLQLSPTENAEMQAALERLAQKDIADPSLELSGSLCPPAGGAGAGGGAP